MIYAYHWFPKTELCVQASKLGGVRAICKPNNIQVLLDT